MRDILIPNPIGMAKDFFQDITPPSALPSSVAPRAPREPESEPPPAPPAAPVPERTIRNIQVSAKPRPRVDSMDVREAPVFPPEPPQGRRMPTKIWMWGGAAALIVILGALAFVALRPTSVSVVPRSQVVTFDQSAHFTAYPAPAIASSTLSFTVQTSDIEDSAVVPTSGTERAADKAQGSITIFNAYSTESVKLIKTTRFATPDGLIFRVPADVVVPGKKGSTPGKITVTVFADEAGEKYNVSPAKFTLPGLKSTAAMYTGVYATSEAAMTGGFSGDQPGVAPGALESAKAQVRTRLEAKAHQAALATAGESTTIFPELISMTYQSLPNTVEAGGGVRIHEKAHVEVPVFSAEPLAEAIAETAGANTEGAQFIFKPASDFAVQGAASSTQSLGETLTFSLSGNGLIVWKVNTDALKAALAGRGSEAFQGIVNGFTGIQEAHARIEPFWKSTFPAEASDIKVKIEEPSG